MYRPVFLLYIAASVPSCTLVAGGAPECGIARICAEPPIDGSNLDGGLPDAANDLLDANLADASSPDAAPPEPDAMAFPQGLVAWYPMEEAPSGAFRDFLGNHPGTCTSCPKLTTGRIGKAYQFEGNQYFRIPTSPALTTVKGTITFWADVPSPNNASLVSKPFGSASMNSLLTILWGDGTLAVEGTSEYVGSGSGKFEFGQWHHIAYTRTATRQALYVDGKQVIDAAITTSFDGNDFLIGSEIDNGYNLFFLIGKLDELRFYNRVLSPAEIAAEASQ